MNLKKLILVFLSIWITYRSMSFAKQRYLQIIYDSIGNVQHLKFDLFVTLCFKCILDFFGLFSCFAVVVSHLLLSIQISLVSVHI